MRYLFLVAAFFISTNLFSGPWYQKADFAGDARHRSTAFSIGNKGYIGLGHINSGIDIEYEDFWRYDPASNAWSQIASYPEGKCYHAASFVVDNAAYVGTGRLENGSYTKHFYKYNPQTNIWTAITDFPAPARRGAVGFSLGINGYVGTGQENSGYTKSFFQYNTLTNQWTAMPDLPGSVRTSSVGFSIGNFGYIGTGELTGGAGNDFYQFDPLINSWTQKANVGPTARQEAVGFSVGGKGYIGTGDDFSSGNNFADFWEYNPSTNSWMQIADFDGTARRYLVAFALGNRAYLGTGTNGTNFKDFWMFDRYLSLAQEFFGNLKVDIYPNPTTENFFINISGLSSAIDRSFIKIELIDLTGKMVSSSSIENDKLKVDVSEMKNATYFYVIRYESTILKQGKLIVNH
jgi:N-acetylneuraminic acid mutarotase